MRPGKMIVNAGKMTPNADGVDPSPGRVVKYVSKDYVYMPMCFALLVQMLQLRYEHNKKRKVS